MKTLLKIFFVVPLLSTVNLKASQYETDDVADIVYDLPVADQTKIDQDLEAEPTVGENSAVSVENFRKSYNYLKRITVLKGENHKKTLKAAKVFEIQKIQVKNENHAPLQWSTEVFETAAPFYTNDFLGRFQQWINHSAVMTEEDQALNFIATENNKLELFTGYTNYHNQLLSDIANAKETIHMQMFGWHADGYGKELAKILAERAQKGIKVRLILDKFSAGMSDIMFVTGKPMKEILKTMTDAGVELIMPSGRGFNRLDHRKLYVIDGKIAWSTGYTISDLMRNDIMDQGTRIQGDLTYQMQASFLTTWLYFGGELREAQGSKESMTRFMKNNFKPLDETGSAKVKLLSNISGVRLDVTQDYYTKISQATKQVIVVNRNFADPRFGKALLQAKKNGAEVIVVLEEGTSSIFGLYHVYAQKYLKKFQDAGIKTYYFRDKDGKALLHSKIVLTDDWVSTGSANFDLFSLFHNAEQNLITQDLGYVSDVRQHLLNDVVQYSHEYVAPKGVFRKLTLSLKALLFKSYEIIF